MKKLPTEVWALVAAAALFGSLLLGNKWLTLALLALAGTCLAVGFARRNEEALRAQHEANRRLFGENS